MVWERRGRLHADIIFSYNLKKITDLLLLQMFYHVFLNFVLHLPGNESFFCLDPHPYRFYLDPESVSKLCLNPDLQENFSDPGSGSATVFNRTIK